MKKVKAYFEQLGFHDEELATILEAFTLKEFKKNDHIAEFGKTSRHIGFVESGMFQYYVLRDGQEITHYVSITNTFLASLLSFLKEVPSLENVRAVTNSSVSMLSKTGLKKLINNVPGFKDFYIGLLEWALCGIDSSRHNLLVLTAEQRCGLKNAPGRTTPAATDSLTIPGVHVRCYTAPSKPYPK